jgi:hypothetical protein
VELSVDEFEAIRLADYEGLEHLEASRRMNISRSTFTRLVDRARRQVSRAIVEGKELVIAGGHVDFIQTLHRCGDCGEVTPRGWGEPAESCPECGSRNMEDLAPRFAGPGQGGGRGRRGAGAGRGRGAGRRRGNDRPRSEGSRGER